MISLNMLNKMGHYFKSECILSGATEPTPTIVINGSDDKPLNDKAETTIKMEGPCHDHGQSFKCFDCFPLVLMLIN